MTFELTILKHLTQEEHSSLSSIALCSTSEHLSPKSTPPTIHPSAAATQAADLVAADGSMIKEPIMTVPESVLDRLLKATRPISPSNPRSALELLKFKYEVYHGMLRVGELAEHVNNDPPPGPGSTDLPTSVAEHTPMDPVIPPKLILDLYGNKFDAKLESYSSLAVKPVPHGSSSPFLLAPAPIIYEGHGTRSFAKHRAKFTYADRYLPPVKPTVPSPDGTPKQPDISKAGSRASDNCDTAPSARSLKASQGYPTGPRLLPNGQAHLDSSGPPRPPGMPTQPLPPLPKGPSRSYIVGTERGDPVVIAPTVDADAPPLTSHNFEEGGLGATLDYDSAFFPSLPPRKGTPPPSCFGRGSSRAIATLPCVHSSLPHSREEYNDAVLKLTARISVVTNGSGDSDWRVPPWYIEEVQPESPHSASSESDLAYAGYVSYGSSDSPYRSAYFALPPSGEERLEEECTSSFEGEATPKAADVYKQ